MLANFGSYPLNQIVTGDARSLAVSIPDESIDIIFTDPIYQNKDDYIWLGNLAMRILKNTGVMLCWSNGKWHRENSLWLESTGLKYRYEFGCVMYGGAAPMNGKIISKNNRVIWLDKYGESSLVDFLVDGYASVSDKQQFGNFKWTKSPKFTTQCIRAFDGRVVYDPFCGEGTVPFCAVTAGKNFIASEIESDRAEEARRKLSRVQVPLWGLTPREPDKGDSSDLFSLSNSDQLPALGDLS
jgi:DNA modification methylase